MDAYPPEYVEHNLPLVVLSGLGESDTGSTSEWSPNRQESGTRIQGSSPLCSGERAQSLLQQFLELDGSNLPWSASSLPGPSGLLRYKIKATGRTCTLPPRKAAPLPQSPSTEGPPNQHGNSTRTELHSPLSPLSPGSPIFPDGVFTPLWFSKHQQQVPALFVAFFQISTTDSQGQDEQLKVDINAIRTALSRSGFKTRFAAVLLGDRSLVHAPELEERLSSIRRLTSLDSKTGLFFMPPMSSRGEVATFVHSVMTTLQPLCVEHYRELTKHARRKKSKGGRSSFILNSNGAGVQSLSNAGWNVRYEVKQGVFAEFRQEMDVAERHYSAAIDELFTSEGVFETAASGSPRWYEARLLSDSLALRVLRCQLWGSLTTATVQSWVNYKARMKDLMDRRGPGSNTYAWDAWEARWAEIMAQLIHRADLPSLRKPDPKVEEESAAESALQVYASPEKSFAAGERLQSFYSLHHSGYWLRMAVRGSRARRKKALAIPESDRIPPDQSPATVVSNRTNYDHYLVPSPHEEFENSNSASGDQSPVENMMKFAQASTDEFQSWNQHRMSDIVTLERTKDLIEVGRFDDAMQILKPLWERTSWRGEDWHKIFTELLLSIRQCATVLQMTEMLVCIAYELLCIPSIPSEVLLDIQPLLEDQESSMSQDSEVVPLTFKDKERLSPVTISFAYASKETYVGEALQCQLRLWAQMCDDIASLTLKSVTLTMGSSKSIEIEHDPDSTDSHEDIVELALASKGEDNSLQSKADLKLLAGKPRTFNFYLKFQTAESIVLKHAAFALNVGNFRIEHQFTDDAVLGLNSILVKRENDAVERISLPNKDTTTLTVLPKPPKVNVLVHGLRKEFYTDERVRLTVELGNDETETVAGTVSASIQSDTDHGFPLQWAGTDQTAVSEKPQEELGAPVVQTISELDAATSRTFVLLLQAPQDPTKASLAIDVDYSLPSDRTTSLRKNLPIELSFTMPFDVKFNFGPLLYQGKWPSYFDPQLGGKTEQSGGIPQLWRLSSQIQSLAAKSIVLHKVETVVDDVIGDSKVKATLLNPIERHALEPGRLGRFSFELRTQKYALDDRRPTTIESTLAITWSCDDDTEPATTHLPVPRLSLPVSEPRVLCTLLDKETADDCDAVILYHIENPSTHFLTFALTMEATEEFAFSGPKYRALSLAPLSRQKVEYRISLQDIDETQSSAGKEGGQWIWPSLQVIDSYYQKALRVHPGGAGVKFDEKQNVMVWIEN